MREALDRFADHLSDRAVFWPALPAYVLLIGFLRFWLFPGASQDDAEQLILAQTLAGGYNPAQPPLYTWLVYLVGRLIGPGLGAVLIVKYACLFALYAFMALAGKEIMCDARRGRLAALALFCLLYVGYEAVFNYSNTIVQATLCAATLYALARVGRYGRWSDYAGLGLAVGIGLLSKYGYALFICALLLGAMTIGHFRARLLSGRLIFSIAIVLAVLAPHVYWLATSGADLAATFGRRLSDGAVQSYWAGVDKGLFKLVNGIVVFLSPLFVVALVLFPRIWWRTGATATMNPVPIAWKTLFERFFWIAIGFLLVAVFALGVANVRTHYMFILLGAPIYMLLRADAVATGPWPYRALALTGFVFAAIWMLALVGRFLWEPQIQKRPYFHMPYPALAQKLRASGFERGTILAHFARIQIGGNLKAQFPDARVRSTKYGFYDPPASERPGACLLVWIGTGPIPAALSKLAAGEGVSDLAAFRAGRISAPLLRSPSRSLTLSYRLLPGGQGRCR